MSVTYRNLTTLPKPIGLYSHVAHSANFAFFAGMAAIGPDGGVVGKGDFEQQMRTTFSEIAEALKGEGLSFTNIVQMTTYIVRAQDVPTFYQVRKSLYRDYYADASFPPHTLLIVSQLVDPDLLIEVQITAAT